MNLCSIDDCEVPVHSRGMCVKHYHRVMRNGDPHINKAIKVRSAPHPDLKTAQGVPASQLIIRPGYERVAAAIFERLEPGPEGCWLWTGALNDTGYGKVHVSGGVHVSSLTHRALYTAVVGDPTPGWHLDHLCRRRNCCNPGHLDDVPPRTNLRRGLGPVAERSRQRSCKHGHEFTEQNTGRSAQGTRYCKRCVADRVARAKARRRAAAAVALEAAEGA